MRTLAALLALFACCFVAHANDASTELAKHLGQSPALVVVVCGEDAADLDTVREITTKTPWILL